MIWVRSPADFSWRSRSQPISPPSTIADINRRNATETGVAVKLSRNSDLRRSSMNLFWGPEPFPNKTTTARESFQPFCIPALRAAWAGARGASARTGQAA